MILSVESDERKTRELYVWSQRVSFYPCFSVEEGKLKLMKFLNNLLML